MGTPLVLAVFLSLLFGGLSAAIAYKKNRSVSGWFFVGLLLGPFGLLVIFFPRIKPVVLVVDMQADFSEAHDGSLAVPGSGPDYVEKISDATNQLKNLGLQVIATQDWHPDNHMSFASTHDNAQPFDTIELPNGRVQVLWPKHCVEKSDGAAILIDSTLIDSVIHKGSDPRFDSYSGFRDDGGSKTDLDATLTEAGVKTLIVYGIATDYCVKATVLDAIKLGYQVYVIKELCRGVNEETSREALEEMSGKGAIVAPDLESLKNMII